jgi:hypothetical protein
LIRGSGGFADFVKWNQPSGDCKMSVLRTAGIV